ncbi:MAG TPA: tetratricopeptide repeat protein [Bryobacteraceae bacterium]|nr:tetratricopeptide repeat protein [Bryobacteraceae bacterium]
MAFLRIALLGISIVGWGAAADLGRGRDLHREGKYSEAADELRQVVRDDDGNAEAHRLLGVSLLETGAAGEAAKHIERALELSPNGDTHLAAARLAVAQKNWDRAEQMLGEASGDDLEYVRGMLHLNRGRNEEALRDLEAYTGRHNENAYAHYYAGLAANNLRRPDRMLHHFEIFLKMKPDAPEARKVRSVVRAAK